MCSLRVGRVKNRDPSPRGTEKNSNRIPGIEVNDNWVTALDRRIPPVADDSRTTLSLFAFKATSQRKQLLQVANFIGESGDVLM